MKIQQKDIKITRLNTLSRHLQSSWEIRKLRLKGDFDYYMNGDEWEFTVTRPLNRYKPLKQVEHFSFWTKSKPEIKKKLKKEIMAIINKNLDKFIKVIKSKDLEVVYYGVDDDENPKEFKVSVKFGIDRKPYYADFEYRQQAMTKFYKWEIKAKGIGTRYKDENLKVPKGDRKALNYFKKFIAEKLTIILAENRDKWWW